MSAAKQRQVAITATWKNGKDGYIAAIDESALNYSADPSMTPSEFGKLSAKQAVANYGGYLKAHKGLGSDYLYDMANTIAQKYESIDAHLTSDADTIMGVLSDLEAQRIADLKDKERIALYLGDTTETLAKRLKSITSDLKTAISAATTIKAQVMIRDVMAELQAMLPASGEAVETTERVLIA